MNRFEKFKACITKLVNVKHPLINILVVALQDLPGGVVLSASKSNCGIFMVKRQLVTSKHVAKHKDAVRLSK